MSKKDIHATSFNLSSSIKFSTRIPILFPKYYEVWVSHFEDYIYGIEKHGQYIWKSITKGAKNAQRQRNIF